MAEYRDLYNSKREPIGKIVERGADLLKGEYYLATEFVIQNSKNQVLITRRALNKRLGGMWEFSGGSVVAGEDMYEATIREAQEELGIGIVKEDLKLLLSIKDEKKHYFLDMFLIRKDYQLEDLTFQDGEVIDAKWVENDVIQTMYDNGEFVHSVYSRFRDANMLS